MAENGTTPGWYEDPRSPADTIRYWDGSAWTNHTQARPPAGVPASSQHNMTGGIGRQTPAASPTRRNLQPCPDCGAELSPMAVACVRCGRPMTAFAASAGQSAWARQQATDDKSGRYALEAAIWVIVFVVGLAIAFVFPLALIVVLIAGVGFIGALIRSIAAKSKSREQAGPSNIFGP